MVIRDGETELKAVVEEPELEDEYPTQVEEADVGYFSGESEADAEEVYEEEGVVKVQQNSYPDFSMSM